VAYRSTVKPLADVILHMEKKTHVTYFHIAVFLNISKFYFTYLLTFLLRKCWRKKYFH